MNGCSSYATTSSVWALNYFVVISHSDRKRGNNEVVLICINLMINNVEHFCVSQQFGFPLLIENCFVLNTYFIYPSLIYWIETSVFPLSTPPIPYPHFPSSPDKLSLHFPSEKIRSLDISTNHGILERAGGRVDRSGSPSRLTEI